MEMEIKSDRQAKSLQSIDEAAALLKVSRSTILRRMESDWKEGKQYFDIRSPSSKKRLIRIDINAVNDLYSIPSHKRK
jgi:hypothetical protein